MQIFQLKNAEKTMNTNLDIDGVSCNGYAIATPNATLLVINAPNGLLGCGYFSLATADQLNDALAVVRGVSNFDDMLNAKVCEVSAAAEKLGIAAGMSGKDALKLMK